MISSDPNAIGWFEYAFMILFFTALPLVIMYVFAASSFIKYLKNNHVDLWSSIGSPTSVFSQGSSPTRIISFIMKKEFVQKGDSLLIRKGNLTRALLFVSVFTFMSLVLLFLGSILVR